MKKENRKSNQRSVIASEVIRSAAISQSYEEIASSSRTPPRNDKTLVSSSFLVFLFFCFLVFPQTTLAAETCCKCQRDAENFCVNLSDVQDCNGAQLKSQSLANVQKGNESLFVGFNCSAALTPTQCRTIAQGGVCGGSPLAPTELINALKAADKQEADDQSSGSSISSQKTPLPPLTKPELGVKIPGLDFSDVRQVEGGFLIIPFLAQYISAAYRYLIGVSVIVAIIVVMYGGFLYMVGSAVSDVKRGKKYIFDAILGLVIILSAYLILQTVNPATLKLDAIRIRQIEVVPLVEEDSGDSAGDLDPTIEKTPGVYCPRTGGADELPKIVQSLAEKVTYRWGGKGGSPPYPEKKSGPYAAFANFCPPGTLCLDCSGFVNFVRSCAGFPKISGNTTDMFQNAEKIDKIDMQNKTVNGIALQPGDLFGYTASESKSGAGHVIMYVGRGRTVQSRGGKTGRQPGANPVFSPIPSDNKTYKHILRVQAP